MSLAPNSASAIPYLTPVAPASQWNNPIPEHFYNLDDRYFRLHNMNNRFLEMHETTVRSSSRLSKYSILTIMTYMINISTLPNISFSSQPKADLKRLQQPQKIEIRNRVIIRGNVTGNFLCMNNESVLYPSKIHKDDCIFVEEFLHQNNSNLYYREFNDSKWYVAINRDDSIRCGNVSRKNQKGSMFFKVEVKNGDTVQNTDIKEAEKPPCCTKDRCDKRTGIRHKKRKHPRGKNKNDRKEINEGQENKEGKKNKCRTYTKWCRKKRQRFFSLKLKDLKKYYKRCLKDVRKSEQTNCNS